MYSILSGPLVWIAFIVFIGGLVYRFIRMLKLAQKEKVIYPYMSLKYSLRSLLHWVIPFASKNMRISYEVTIVTFIFHISAVLLPLFIKAHMVMFTSAWGISWVTISDSTANFLTLLVIFSCIFFFIRRLMLPEVRFVTFTSDYLLLAIVVAPFVTGYMANQHWFNYEIMLTIHIISGAVMLMVIPFTRLSHMLYFPFARSYMGSEFGAVRNSKDW